MARLLKSGVVPAPLWPACVGAFAVLSAVTGGGAWTRRSAIAWMIGSWATRLAVQASYARTSELPLLTSYFEFLTFCVLFSLPALFASRNAAPSLSPVELGAAAVWLIAFAGETTADRQRLRFTSQPEHEGLPCRTGIWRRLPHAHAWFEVILWVAVALFALPSPWGWLASACVPARLYLLRRV